MWGTEYAMHHNKWDKQQLSQQNKNMKIVHYKLNPYAQKFYEYSMTYTCPHVSVFTKHSSDHALQAPQDHA